MILSNKQGFPLQALSVIKPYSNVCIIRIYPSFFAIGICQSKGKHLQNAKGKHLQQLLHFILFKFWNQNGRAFSSATEPILNSFLLAKYTEHLKITVHCAYYSLVPFTHWILCYREGFLSLVWYCNPCYNIRI